MGILPAPSNPDPFPTLFASGNRFGGEERGNIHFILLQKYCHTYFIQSLIMVYFGALLFIIFEVFMIVDHGESFLSFQM